MSREADWFASFRQEFVEPAGGVTVGYALQDVSEPGSTSSGLAVASNEATTAQPAAPPSESGE